MTCCSIYALLVLFRCNLGILLEVRCFYSCLPSARSVSRGLILLHKLYCLSLILDSRRITKGGLHDEDSHISSQLSKFLEIRFQVNVEVQLENENVQNYQSPSQFWLDNWTNYTENSFRQYTDPRYHHSNKLLHHFQPKPHLLIIIDLKLIVASQFIFDLLLNNHTNL